MIFWPTGRQSRHPQRLAQSALGQGPALFTHWSVSYNKWTTGPGAAGQVLDRRHDGSEVTEQHADLRHTAAQSEFTFPLACARWKNEGEMFWRHAFVAHDERRTDAASVLARHRLKGAKEQLFKHGLRGLDRHHPPGESLTAHRMFYAIAALACNLIKAVPILCLPDACPGWTAPTLLKQMVRLPAVLVRHARVLVARVAVAASWLSWWQKWQTRWWPAGPAAPGAVPSG